MLKQRIFLKISAAIGLATIIALAGVIDTSVAVTGSDATTLLLNGGSRCPGQMTAPVVYEGADLNDGVFEIHHWRRGVLMVSLMSCDQPEAIRNRHRRRFSALV